MKDIKQKLSNTEDVLAAQRKVHQKYSLTVDFLKFQMRMLTRRTRYIAIAQAEEKLRFDSIDSSLRGLDEIKNEQNLLRSMYNQMKSTTPFTLARSGGPLPRNTLGDELGMGLFSTPTKHSAIYPSAVTPSWRPRGFDEPLSTVTRLRSHRTTIATPSQLMPRNLMNDLTSASSGSSKSGSSFRNPFARFYPGFPIPRR